MAQIRQVVSEALQSTVRRLLPSQQGFTEDLQASNVIMPIIDLTPTAEGSLLATDLAGAIAFGSQTAFDLTAAGTVSTLTGFVRLQGIMSVVGSTGTGGAVAVNLSDGFSTKQLLALSHPNDSPAVVMNEFVDIIVFCDTGISITATFTGTNSRFAGSVRQVADSNGVIVNPSGFSPS